MAYTSRCSGKTLESLRVAGWRFIIEPSQGYRSPSPLPFAIDNGAWGCFRRGDPWDAVGFRRVLRDHGEGADWIVLPDVVGDGPASLILSREWVDEVEGIGRPVMLAVQDGMTADHARPFLERGAGLFVGGSTEWKVATMRGWGLLGRDFGCWVHVARVNSRRRIKLSQEAGAKSFDGNSPTLFRKTLAGLDGCRRQGDLFGLI